MAAFRTLGIAVAALLLLSLPASGGARPAPAAAAIYEQRCAECHGSDGQGVAGAYGEPLAGDDSIATLAVLIERTMPEGEPEACVGEEARQVAAYIYDEFYSLEARQRKGLVEPPRVELARLTVPQYRNAVADLIGHFTPLARSGSEPAENLDEQPGLRAEYFQSKGMNKADELQQQRVDRYVDFDFGAASPAENITADQFAIIWEGSLIAEETGDYEFRIRSENGARLYVNRDGTGRRGKLRDDSSLAGEPALIDGWVSSGEMRELSARIFLLGGRRYPLRLEFFKYLQETASIELQWKPPQGTWAVLDHNHLSTAPAKRLFVVDTPFPADDRSTGYERGTAISPAWHAATTSAAIATAAEVIQRLPQLAGLEDRRGDDDRSGEEAAQRLERLKAFVVQFASLAFRRPLTETETTLFRERLFADSKDPELAVRRAVLLVLKSPHFLYTDLTSPGESPTPFTAAARLALALWDSLPDATLREAASNGQLATAEQIRGEAERMLDSPRTRAKMRDFFRDWLEIEERDLMKDPQRYPEFDEAAVTELRYSLERFIDQVVWSKTSDYRELLLADFLVLNDRLSRLYGVAESAPAPTGDAAEADGGSSVAASETVAPGSAAPGSAEEATAAGQVSAPDSEFRIVAFDPEQRSGLLTHPYLLSAFAYHDNTSPIHRGVFLARNVIGRSLRPPPVAVAFKDEEFDPGLTMREKITQLTSDQACMSCHAVINPLGFALETYDAIGRWRSSEDGKPIEATGRYETRTGEVLEVAGARQVAEFAARSEAAQRAFITSVFQHLAKQSPAAYGPRTIDELHAGFVEDEFHILKLWARIATTIANHGRSPADPVAAGRTRSDSQAAGERTANAAHRVADQPPVPASETES